MCGIAGYVNFRSDSEGQHLIRKMTDQIAHRGPDADGYWTSANQTTFFGHRRLAIIDLSPTGAQPMQSRDGRYSLTFNGEIYNYLDLKKELIEKGEEFRGPSDTEVLLALIVKVGVEAALRRCNGMFAFGLWDHAEGVLTLARDYFGEKPLYYSEILNGWIFGSELKVLRAHPQCSKKVDREALAGFLGHGYVAAPRTIYQGVQQLMPGTFLKVAAGLKPEIRSFYSARETFSHAIKNPATGTAGSLVESLDGLLSDAVKIRMQSDVPLGAFLSGGIDSSVIVALMQKQSSRPVETFSIGFHEKAYDEAEHARAVARHLGTHHTDLYVTAEEARSVIPKLAEFYDEPFADSSQIPTYLVSQLARTQVTVSLSGDAGDELFGGYTRYTWGERVRHLNERWPSWMLKAGKGLIGSLSPAKWNSIYSAMGPLLPSTMQARLPGEKLQKLREVLGFETSEEIYRFLISQIPRSRDWVLGLNPQSGSSIISGDDQASLGGSFAEWMMLQDVVGYLPDDILVKLDRASMAHALEGRIPFLDPRVVEFAWKLPLSMKIRDGETKWILRQVLDRYVPRALVERPKMGFGVPIDDWLRGPLREWAEALLSEDRLSREGYLDSKRVRKLWQEHLSGSFNRQHALWNILSFQMWLEAWIA